MNIPKTDQMTKCQESFREHERPELLLSRSLREP
jgi:hypothetical protein